MENVLSTTPTALIVDMQGIPESVDLASEVDSVDPVPTQLTAKLVELRIRNLGCIGPEGLIVELDKIVCLVGKNNAGKSTILRAYELAQGNSALTKGDRCQLTPEGDHPEVILDVHIPDSVKNVDRRWRIAKGDLLIVRSRWVWRADNLPPERSTWDPELNDHAGGWAEDGKAAGADNVFKSRLPKPLRIDALRDAIEQHDDLLKLILEPIVAELKGLQSQADSSWNAAMKLLMDAAMTPVEQFSAEVKAVSDQIGEGFGNVFPELKVTIDVGIDSPAVDLAKALQSGSAIKFDEGSAKTGVRQQGAGSRRALFWTLLRVHNILQAKKQLKKEREAQVRKAQSDIDKENKKKSPDEEKIAGLLQIVEGKAEVEEGNDVSLPAHILLIDEPENCLHPMAVRAARDQLYTLALDPSWQIMMCTHSPFFIDPLRNHTTIVRIERSAGKLTPRTYRTDQDLFSEDERENLRALIQLDTALAEMFFGSYPVLVEGDTELAAYIAAILEPPHALATKISIVPARGKALLPPLIKLLAHFKIDFGILHDLDSPQRRDGKANGAWTMNRRIADCIYQARSEGVAVRHRVSVPDFERFLGDMEEEKDKPIVAYKRIRNNHSELIAQIQNLFQALHDSEAVHPDTTHTQSMTVDALIEWQLTVVKQWAAANAAGDPRFG